MTMNRNGLAAFAAVLISVFSSASLYAGTIGTVDLSANVIESILPGGTVFHDSKPLFGTTIDPIQSAELLHISDRASTPGALDQHFRRIRIIPRSRTAMGVLASAS
jgi:hypothetical protein